MPAEKQAPKAQEKIVNFPGVTKSYTKDDSERKWVLVDAKGHRVGRLATQIADLLRGKHKPTFTRHNDVGDFVVVINAQDMVFHGNNKPEKKIYYKHTTWLGHLKQFTAQEMMDRKPEHVLWLAVRGMVPGEGLRHTMLRKLKVYKGPDHPHKAQKPEPVKIKYQKHAE